MSEHSVIQNTFRGWKMWLGVLIGFSVALWMLYTNVTAVRFIQVTDGSGTYEWFDVNQNNRVDLHLPEEFVFSERGAYRQQKISDTLQHIHWTFYSVFWILLAIIFAVGRDFFYMVRIRLLTHKVLSWRSSFNVIMLWEFASALSPGVMSGAAVAMFILKHEKIALGRSTAIVFVTAMMDNFFYILIIPFVFAFIDHSLLFPSEMTSSDGVKWVFWTGYLIYLFLAIFLFISLFVFPQLAGWLLRTIFSIPVLGRFKNGAVKTGKDIELASSELKREPLSFWLKTFAATCCSWTCRYLVINALLQAFLHLNFFDHVIIYGKQFVLWLFMRMSPTPGGSGIAEYAFGELLAPFSQSALLLVGLAILWRLISYFPYLFIGAFILPRWLKKQR
ncbi:MAG: YbhN family protein [Flavobacteriia bacterium]